MPNLFSGPQASPKCAATIKPVDPVSLGLVGQLELDAVVKKASDKKNKDAAKRGETAGATLQPAAETGAVAVEEPAPERELQAADVWATDDDDDA